MTDDDGTAFIERATTRRDAFHQCQTYDTGGRTILYLAAGCVKVSCSNMQTLTQGGAEMRMRATQDRIYLMGSAVASGCVARGPWPTNTPLQAAIGHEPSVIGGPGHDDVLRMVYDLEADRLR